jgi:hypothetical protein
MARRQLRNTFILSILKTLLSCPSEELDNWGVEGLPVPGYRRRAGQRSKE